MCGILATVNVPFDQSALEVIRHRGPDGSGICQTMVGGHLVTLGHRRLSILDLSPAGSQPMWTADRRHAIVFNGEIYNHQGLREGSDFRGHSDTETILRLIAKRGMSATLDFNGIFSFCFLDTADRKLYLVRDPFGIKPLYYRADKRTVVCCSELRGIREFFDDPLDEDSLAELLRLRYLPAPDTLFRNVRKLRPGHIAEIDLGGDRPRVIEYPYAAARRERFKGNHGDAVEEYGTRLRAAVERQLLSDVEVGVLLSGGIDSAILASLAQRAAPYRMKAFTVGFTGNHVSDEIADAAVTAQRAGMEHHSVRIGPDDFLRTIADINTIVEEPLATTSIVPMFALSRIASGHVKVVLSGQGADETMGGYRRYQLELLRGFVPRWSAPLVRLAFRRVRGEAISRGIAALGLRDDVSRFETVYAVFDPNEIFKLIGRRESRAHPRIQYFFDLLACSAQKDSVRRMMTLDARMNLADDLLLYTDKITMHHSLECRVPLLDLDLVRFIESLPRRWCVGIGGGKRIHKTAARRILPASIVNRKKKGFNSPAGEWLRSEAVQEILLERNSRFSSFFDLREVQSVLTAHANGSNRERHIFLLLSLHFWMRESLRPRTPAFGCAVAV